MGRRSSTSPQARPAADRGHLAFSGHARRGRRFPGPSPAEQVHPQEPPAPPGARRQQASLRHPVGLRQPELGLDPRHDLGLPRGGLCGPASALAARRLRGRAELGSLHDHHRRIYAPRHDYEEITDDRGRIPGRARHDPRSAGAARPAGRASGRSRPSTRWASSNIMALYDTLGLEVDPQRIAGAATTDDLIAWPARS